MKANDLFIAFDELDDDILQRSEAPVPRRKTPIFRKWVAFAACIILAASLAGVTFAAEAREYSDAVEFFRENGLSTDGLSRSDIKAVYRDITTKRFTYGKTAEVIVRAVPGLEIYQPEISPEELAALWEKAVRSLHPGDGISYRTHTQEKLDEALGYYVHDKSILECYHDSELLWAAEFSDFVVENSIFFSGTTAVWGHRSTLSGEKSTHSYVARVDESGSILWQRQLQHGFRHEYIRQILDNRDGTWAVISLGDYEYLCLSLYDSNGNELSFRQTEIGNLDIRGAVRLGEGYLVQLWNGSDGETARLVRLDREGNLLDTFTYEAEDCIYTINCMLEFEGRVYLSAYAVPKQYDKGGRHEIADILKYMDEKNPEISDEELTALLRDNYTAVLLVCDRESGVPEKFYSVYGSLGGALSVNDAGELAWDVENIVSASSSPLTSAFSIRGTCRVLRCTFDGSGNLLSKEDTGEIAPYFR
ncbi:MAG: hypothetical protein PUC05_04745 [Firmicutes bacterium]|nr:hypothetical protein [Bacillota bacterium]